jgi:hypothetical protein
MEKSKLMLMSINISASVTMKSVQATEGKAFG